MTMTLLVIALLPSRLQSVPHSACWLYVFFLLVSLVIVSFRRIVVVLCLWLLFDWFGNLSTVGVSDM